MKELSGLSVDLSRNFKYYFRNFVFVLRRFGYLCVYVYILIKN
jgi:hypothetical protein